MIFKSVKEILYYQKRKDEMCDKEIKESPLNFNESFQSQEF
jgi:hypothetical protein